MGNNTLNARSSGDVITADFFNDFNTALQTEFVGRNSSGAPVAGESMGTVSVPWGTGYFNSINLAGAALDVSQITSPANRIVSGAVRSTSNQPAFLDPAGSGLSVQILGNTTNLVFDVNGTSATCSTDITISSLTAAPSSNNTCLLNDGDAADQESTRTWGEQGAKKEHLTIDTIGSEISSLNGKWAAFKINDGSSDEYFLAYVDTTNNQLKNIRRGYFYDSSINPMNRIKIANNDTITLMKLVWVFIQNDGTTTDVTYTNPKWSSVAPTGPATGDYWYDIPNSTWKRYSGSSWVVINRTLLGIAINDATNTVGARCLPYYHNWQVENSIRLSVLSNTQIESKYCYDQTVNVDGTLFKFGQTKMLWDITSNLAGSADMYNAAEQASTVYYMYVKDTGDRVISDISPYYMPEMACGYYHPHNPWRCVGMAFNDGSSNLVLINDIKFNPNVNEVKLYIKDVKGSGSAGGTFSTGSWQTRTLNVLNETATDNNDGSDYAYIGSNRFTTIFDNVDFEGYSAGFYVNVHQSRLYDITNSTLVVTGTNQKAIANTQPSSNTSITAGTVHNPGVATTMEFQARCQTGRGSDGYGQAGSWGNEVYASIILTLR